MKLTLSQQELEQALRNYVTGMINLQPGTDIMIDFKAGRGDNGFTAEVEISSADLAKAQQTTLIYPPGARNADMENKAEKPPFEVNTDVTNRAETPTPEDIAKSKAKAKNESETKTEVRQTSGKSLFGAEKDKDAKGTDKAASDDTPAKGNKDTKAANDDAGEPETKTTGTGGRRTLFSE